MKCSGRTAGLLVLCCLITGSRGISIPDATVRLDDNSFEHLTQASTGQTTGVWFVLLASTSDATHQPPLALWQHLAGDEDSKVLFATVDVDVSKVVEARFQELRPEGQQGPLALLLRSRKVFVYSGLLEGDGASEAVNTFATEGYQSADALEVPPAEPEKGRDWVTIGGTVLSFALFEVGRQWIDRRLTKQRAASAAAAAGAADAAVLARAKIAKAN